MQGARKGLEEPGCGPDLQGSLLLGAALLAYDKVALHLPGETASEVSKRGW